MLYYTDKNWYHFIKEHLEQFSKFVFQKVVFQPVGQPNRHILEVLLTHRHTLVAQNHQASVSLYTTGCIILRGFTWKNIYDD